MSLVLLVGLAVRLLPYGLTFTDSGVRFRSDTDPYYHALRAQRIVADWPYVPWSDSRMNFPYGARIPWPPLFDVVIAGLSHLIGATAATPELVAKVAAWLALVVGVALLPLVALLGRRLLGGGLWIDAALIVAVVSGNVRYGAVGAADQHGAELLISTAIFLAFAGGWVGEPETRRAEIFRSLGLGGLIALAFWNWLGSALYLLLLGGVTGLWHMIAPANDHSARRMARTLFGGCLAGTLLLAPSVALFAPAGTLGRGGLDGLTGLHVAMVAVSAAFGGLLLLASRSSGGWRRRFAEAAGAAVVALVPILLIGPLREGIATGLAAVSRGDEWYASISEFRPIMFSGALSLPKDALMVLAMFGLGFFVMPLALPAFVRRWKESAVDRPGLFFLLVFGGTFFFLTLYELRFQLYLTIPMALWVSLAVRDLAKRAAAKWPSKARTVFAGSWTAGIFVVVAPALIAIYPPVYAWQQNGFEDDLFPQMEWLRSVPPADPSRPAVMGEWPIGHAIQYFADKPVVVTPFGTALDEGVRTAEHPSGMEDWSAFLFATQAEEGEKILARRRVGFLVLRSPKNEVRGNLAFAPRGTAPVADLDYSWLKGPIPSVRPEFFRLIPSRLYYFDGMSPKNEPPALGAYRLLAESPSTEWIGTLPPAHLFKTFGVVPGARIVLSGASPGGAATARARIQTNQNRVFEWVTSAPVDAQGHAELRLPYATGANGLVQAGSYSISDGVHQGTLDLGEKDVLGGTMEINLGR
jgi:asparagine N-glycosylation enzyme membrane subunit Stt3